MASALRCERLVKKYGDRADLSRAGDVRRLLGLTLGIEYNTQRVWECTADGTVRWQITGLHGPMAAWVLPGIGANCVALVVPRERGPAAHLLATPPSAAVAGAV